jgi:hypothetical protein
MAAMMVSCANQEKKVQKKAVDEIAIIDEDVNVEKRSCNSRS